MKEKIIGQQKYTKEDLLEMLDFLFLIFLIDKVKSLKEFKLLKDIPKEYVEKVTKDTSKELLKMLARIIKSFLERVNALQEEIDYVVDQVYKRIFVEMFTMLEKYYVQATRREAKEKGIKEGKYKKSIEIAKQLIDILDISTIAKKTGLPIKIVKEFSSSPKDISTNPYE